MSLTASMNSVIHHAQNKNSPTASMKQRELSADFSPCVVFIALVDILQVWNVDKKLENAVKTKVIEPILHQNLHADISAIEPALYKDRFLDMVKSRVKAMEDVGEHEDGDYILADDKEIIVKIVKEEILKLFI